MQAPGSAGVSDVICGMFKVDIAGGGGGDSLLAGNGEKRG